MFRRALEALDDRSPAGREPGNCHSVAVTALQALQDAAPTSMASPKPCRP